MTRAEEIIARARALVGVRFRAQGRDPSKGLDCVGLALAATGTSAESVPRDYALRGDHREPIERGLAALGWTRVAPASVRPGDLVLLEPGAAQFHLAIHTDAGFIHADAALRRVAERPLPFPWPVVAGWRAPEGD
jgi:cell wall-associated NlpC family hydrolase